MNARIAPDLRKVAVSLFFVLLFSVLPNNTEVLQSSYANDSFSDELKNQNDLTQNKENNKITTSTDNKQSNLSSFRLLRSGKTPIKLETVITRFQGDFSGSDGTTRPVTIDLIGTIHFAEKNYYDELNRIFQEYDAVVFEMVTSKEVDVNELFRQKQEDASSGETSILNFVPFVQETLANALGFCYQIDGIDYAASNLKRGDACVEEFLEKLISNGDISNFCLSSVVGAFLDESRGKTEGWLLVLLCAKDKRLAARRLMALELENSNEDEFETFDGETASLDDSSNDDALIAFRNQKALDVARRELRKGRTKLAIFYGAAHLPDFARRLEKDFGMKRSSETRWLTAWGMEKE